ncbi:alpha/beta hydrolase [Nocardia otitidiscaviarum]|uniref:Esterase family protein n=1 Tax=Nocardia otitidiscaviarum TaxID=1823 RepID=A0A516NU77_9NOCA|nr:alpha/beta hydrolase family protein [Nocardia otitidiscaviarum]MBF6178867.1 esterase family protein [Nocardia otitidiscaviarum]MCP9621846.1 esterase family protein [Nocardia otitidiscaviarum]QDP82469.1 esterase family protein [Nocardia otitidiscaviarum]
MRGTRLRKSVLGIAAALLLPLGISVPLAPQAVAAFDPSGFDFWVDSPAMGPIKSRIFRAADGNTNRVVYALDGMRAPETLNGWEIETNVAQVLTSWNINVVMPVGGQSSFYADWNAPSNFFGVPPGAAGSVTGSGATEAFMAGPGKSYRYEWETFLTNQLRWALRDRLGFNPYRNGAFGLSMGGSAALTLAAYHPDQFSFAGSFSGYLNISAPGMREAIRAAMLDAGGYNVDSMAPPWGPQWLRMDPFVFAPTLIANNTRLWIAAGSGVPMQQDLQQPFGVAADRVVRGAPLEALALANTRAFQVRMMSLGAQNVVYSFPNVGLHAWTNWQDEAYRMIPDLSANIG